MCPGSITAGRRRDGDFAGNNRGVALVITLLLLLIVTVIIVAFFSRSRSDYQATSGYASSVQSNALAMGCLDQVVDNFLREIATKSEAPENLPAGFFWFKPRAEGEIYPSMIPEVATAPALASAPPNRNNLVKQSRRNVPFFTGAVTGPDLASSVSTSAASKGGRSMPPVRWDLPHLLLSSDGTSGAAFSPDQVPDWIYVTRQGTTKAANHAGPKDSDRIVGRYAYNVYDVGGLLNINVAGHAGGTKDADIGTKGALAMADLTAIGLSQDDIDTILKWRAPYVNWSTFSSTNPSDTIPAGNLNVSDYLRMGSFNGWLRNPATTEKSGNQFFSRRDLIRFMDINHLPMSALPFLTHFSIDADAPSFSPETDLLKVQNNRVKEGTAASAIDESAQIRINPARYDASQIKSHPLRRGGAEQVSALRARFPLSRLKYVKTNKADRPSGSENLTRAYFGLIPEDDWTWRYEDPEGSTDHIKSLSEIPASRDPNFFEVLKSVIQAGSLGQYKNTIADDPVGCLEPRANRIDEQILRIGACMIDQADEDSYPTRILFNDDGSLTSYGEIYGVEDIPYLHFLRFVAYRTSDNDQDNYKRAYMIQPNLWNPHDPSRSNYPSDEDVPGKFRVVARSVGARALIFNSTSQTTPPEDGWEQITGGGRTFTPSSDEMTFDWHGASDSNFRQTQGLLSSVYPENANVTGNTAGIANMEAANNKGSLSNWTEPLFGPGPSTTGFLVGRITTKPNETIPGRPMSRAPIFTGDPIEFLLQYQPRSGSEFLTYDRIWFNIDKSALVCEQAPGFDTGGSASTFRGELQGRQLPIEPGTSANSLRFDLMYLKSDPRSGRFLWGSPSVRYSSDPTTNTQYFAELECPERIGPFWFNGMYGNVLADAFMGWKDKNSGGWWTLNAPAASSTPDDNGHFKTHREQRFDLGYLTVNRKVSGLGMYYEDHDGVVRRAMAGAANIPPWTPHSASSWGTYAMAKLNYRNAGDSLKTGFPLQTLLNGDGSPVETTNENRPTVLNRPFRSVGELAYTFRDVPWKNIDFSFAESGDAGLLDAFTVYEIGDSPDSATPLVSGKVNLNVCPAPVLKALVKGADRQIASGSSSSAPPPVEMDDYEAVAARIEKYRSTTASPSTSASGDGGPFRNLGELVGRIYGTGSGPDATFVGMHPVDDTGDSADKVLPERLSAATRALADVGTVRTWNLMIDLVAQTGRVGENDGLEDFSVSSESRYWLFLSIDRFTGKVLARSVERVIE